MAMLTIYWRKRICLWCKPSLIFGLFVMLLVLEPVWAINQDQLWLPRDYYRHLRALYKAAEISEETERCAYVIAGTLSQERSTKEHPVFVITCRDQERQSFAYIIDGLTLDILNRPAAPDPELVAQKEMQLKLEKLWLACYQQLKLRTQGLRATNLSQDLPEATMADDNHISFQVDFNATSIQGDTLHYQALCHYEGEKKTIDINARISGPEITVPAAGEPAS